jgi:large subunit ribosomal protein L5
MQEKYKKEVVPALKAKLGLKNVMEVPKIEKVVVNVGFGRMHKEKPFVEMVEKTVSLITGQKPVYNKARKSISNFKIREGVPVGLSVTLRGRKMYDFLYRIIHIVLPRVRDFRGIDKKSFDKNGNYSFGFKENIAFPEISIEGADKIHGLQLVISTTAKSKEDGFLLLSNLGFPFKD